MTASWVSGTDSNWWHDAERAHAAVELSQRLLSDVSENGGVRDYLAREFPDLASEFSAQWIALIERGTGWSTVGEFGRAPASDRPVRLFEEAFDRDSSFFRSLPEPAGWSLAGVPIINQPGQQMLLLISGRSLDVSDLPRMQMVAKTFGECLRLVARAQRDAHQADRLRETLRAASRLSTIFETVPLLEALAEEATRLLNCDRASIFIWDRPNRKLLACPALGVEGRTLYLPDNAGIVGSVIQTGETIRVDDAYSDARFDRSVDRKSGYRTQNLVCVPLFDSERNLIGAFEGINRNHGPFDDDDVDILNQLGLQAAIALRNTRERERLIQSHRQLTQQVANRIQIIGDSPAILSLRERVERLAATDLPVLILGESGTGKEVVAQSLHYRGPRAEHPFVAVNCAALTETLLESELFGHEKGAFTDARDTHKGKFEVADGGTVFLDEIGDMSPGGQAKLLRVLEQKVITRVGGSQMIPVNVRIVAATNVNLAESVRQRKFREDLYYRLNVVTLEIPPLRDRSEDVQPLAEYFLRQFCPQARRAVLEIASDARLRMKAHGWPGNVRELRNLMERVAFLCNGPRVEVDDLAFILDPRSRGARSDEVSGVDQRLADATHDFQVRYIEKATEICRHNMTEVARILGLHRSNLYRKMRQLGMQAPDEDE